jgi:hypothetical protein
MKLSRSIFLLVIALFALSPLPASADIVRNGRKIQLDGFLMDWIEKKRQVWKGSTLWSWDAVNTEEGVAGYFHSAGAAACSSWIFIVDAGRHGPREMCVSSVDSAENQFYRVNRSQQSGHRTSITVEWLLPWDSIVTDGSGAYGLNIRGRSSCGDSLDPVLLTGEKKAAPNSLPSHFNERLGLIVALLAVFIVLRMRIRKKTPRKGSPRRSA